VNCFFIFVVKNFTIFIDADYKTINIVPLDVKNKSWEVLMYLKRNSRPITIDFDPIEKRIYWSYIENSSGYIASVFMNNTSPKILYHKGIVTPDGLAVDWEGRNVYWTDIGSKKLEVGKLDGTLRKILIKSDLDKPRAIALYTENR
jgi:hypothetical protein